MTYVPWLVASLIVNVALAVAYVRMRRTALVRLRELGEAIDDAGARQAAVAQRLDAVERLGRP